MSLIRKTSLKQLQEIDKLMKNDIGNKTIKGYPTNYDTSKDNDTEWEEMYDLSNKLIGEYTAGNFSECFGDVTNDGIYANTLFVHDPLQMSYIQPFEDFGTMSSFGDSWRNRKPSTVQKFDEPDSVLFASVLNDNNDEKLFEKKIVLRTPVSRVITFSEFINEELKVLKPVSNQETDEVFNEFTDPNRALKWSIKNNVPEYINKAIKNGADLKNLKFEFDESAIHYAVRNCNLETVKCLVEHGANVNEITKHKDGDSDPLMIAVLNNKFDIVKYLVENGANVNSEFRYGKLKYTSLMLAARNYNIEIMNYLIEHGADVNIKNKDGQTANDILNSNKKSYPIDWIKTQYTTI